MGNLMIYVHDIDGQPKGVSLKVADLTWKSKKAPDRKKFVADAFVKWAQRQQPEYQQIRKEFEDANVHTMTPEDAKKLEAETKKKMDAVARTDGCKALLATVKDEQSKALAALNKLYEPYKSHDEEQRSLVTAINAATKAKLQLTRDDVTIALFYPDDIEGDLRPSKKIGQLGSADVCHPKVEIVLNPLTGLPMPGAN